MDTLSIYLRVVIPSLYPIRNFGSWLIRIEKIILEKYLCSCGLYVDNCNWNYISFTLKDIWRESSIFFVDYYFIAGREVILEGRIIWGDLLFVSLSDLFRTGNDFVYDQLFSNILSLFCSSSFSCQSD